MANLEAFTAAPASVYRASTRLDSLDLLRGLCALAVAVFHYDSWGGLLLPVWSKGFLALCGTYGVSVFFVLSGFSLAHAYRRKFVENIDHPTLLAYARRRIARLGPLFAVIVIASVVGKIVTGRTVPGVMQVAANITLLFGFVRPSFTPVMGGWSIGVEVVFYVVFPLLMVLRRSWLSITVASILLTVWISFSVANFPSLAAGFRTYVHPANHLLFFVGGVYGAIFLQGREAGRVPAVLGVALALAGMIALSYGASELDVATGWRRAGLVPLSIILVCSISQIRLERARRIASLSGGASYPLYLVHPLIFIALKDWVIGAPVLSLGLLGAAILVALAIDLVIDKPLQRRLKTLGW